MNSSVQDSQARVSARRKLIRGAFSVPAVLAVHNGSALAASSNRLRCAVNGTQGNVPSLPGITSAPDTWTRVQRYYRSSNNVYFVKIADLQAIATAAGLPYAGPTAGNYIRWDNGAIKNLTQAVVGELTLDSSYVAVLFDSNGSDPNIVRVVGIVTRNQSRAPANTSAVSGSCWNSLTP